MPKPNPWQEDVLCVLDEVDAEEPIMLGIIRREIERATAPQFDWNDAVKLFEGGPRAARDRRASRFADC